MFPGAGYSREGEAGLQRARQGGGFFFFLPWALDKGEHTQAMPMSQ